MTADGFVAHILDLLSDWGGASARRMFSGHGLFRQGRMFGLVVRDTLYLRVDERSRAEFEAAGMKPFSYMRAKRVELPYWEAPPELFDDAELMIQWARRADDAALASKAAKPLKARKSRPKRRKITKV